MSDIAATNLVDDSGLFAAAFSRLANTDGNLVIETPPRGARGRVYEIFEQIQKSESEFSLHIVKADQAVTAGLISTEFLNAERQRLGPLYPQYYAAEFIEGTGNIFNIEAINRAIELGKQYNPEEFDPISDKYMCLDPGYSSSKFAILIAEWNRRDRKIVILYANEFDKLNYDEAIDLVFRLIKQYGRVVNVGIDMSSLELVMSLKKKIGEREDWNYITSKLSHCAKHSLNPAQYMTIVPIPFTVTNKAYMISNCRRLLEDSRSLVAINPVFNNLIIGLKSSVVDNRGLLDKQETISDDLVDAFQIMGTFFTFKSSSDY
jgi:hypothetical protein